MSVTCLNLELQQNSIMLLGRLIGVHHLDVVIEIELAPPACRDDLNGVTTKRPEIIDILTRHHTVETVLWMPDLHVDVRLIEYVRQQLGLCSAFLAAI